MMVSPEDDRHNGWVFTLCYVLIYISAPVLYVGVVQAALCDKLGAGATLANLPASTYMFGQMAPLVFSWLVPHRLERSVVVWSNLATGLVILGVALSLALPLPAETRIAAVVIQGLLQGLSASTSQVFMLQCLRRGTTKEGLAQALKRAFTATPVFAVAGSLGAQYLLKPGLPFLPYPYDFVAIHLIAAPCVFGIALAAARFRLMPLADEPRQPFFPFLASAFRGFAGNRPLLLMWFAYLLWYTSLGITSNLSLFTREAMGRDPKDYSGFIMAIRFGCKSIGGYLLGVLAVRHGLRAGVLATIALLAAGAAWAWIVPGAGYLFSFGLLGAGELGGAYIPNYVGSLSTAARATRNFALVTLASPASSFSPVLHGALTDRFGFRASFALGIAAAVAALILVTRVRATERTTD